MLTALALTAALALTGEHHLAIWNINFQDIDGPYRGRLADLQAEADELSDWFYAQSYGQLRLIPTVHDLTVDELSSDIGCKQPKRHLDAMMATLTPEEQESVKFRYGVLPRGRSFPPGKRCGWRGVAPVGCGEKCRAFSQGAGLQRVANHELGHNLGFPHGGSDVGTPDKHPMSGGTGLHFSSFDSVRAGWITPRNARRKELFAAIEPMGAAGEADSVLRVVKIERDNGIYWVSRREPVGQDTGPRENPELFGKLSIHLQSYKDNGRLNRQGRLTALLAPGELFELPDGTAIAAVGQSGPDGEELFVGVSAPAE